MVSNDRENGGSPEAGSVCEFRFLTWYVFRLKCFKHNAILNAPLQSTPFPV